MVRQAGRSPGRFGLGLPLLLSLLGGLADAETLALPAVPYVPQSEELCGGAALAMVLRYWGVPNVAPEDFQDALLPDGTGIPADELARLPQSRGMRTFAFRGTRSEVVSHLEKGRPIIALLGAAPGRFHYVVLLAWAKERVMVHDPAVGPFRTLQEADWQKRWKDADNWALLVLPAEDFGNPPLGPSSSVDPVAAGSTPVLASDPVKERAAQEFRRENWSAAADLAAEATQRDPGDTFSWKLLATSRFLAGQREQALRAWNQIGEPRLDLVRIDGFHQTSTRLVYEYLGERPGSLLTPERVRRVQRRIDALPAVQLSRVTYRPENGTAELEVNVVERPAMSSPLSLLARSATHLVSERAIGADVFVLAPSGDSLRLFGGWRPGRSHGQLTASAARFLGLPGIATAEAMWDEQSYRTHAANGPASTVREQRTRGAVTLAHWWAPNTKAAFSVGSDQWNDRGRYLTLSSEIEERLLADRIALRGSAAGWWSQASAPFYAATVLGSARTHVSPTHARIRMDLSYGFASARAPLSLWGGAGTGSARFAMLRAHPLVQKGVVDGPAFGRQLLSGSAQAEAPLGSIGPATLKAVLFVDAARVIAPVRGATLVDVGAGVRVQPPGWRSALRVDLATPGGRLDPHLSVGWEADWP